MYIPVTIPWNIYLLHTVLFYFRKPEVKRLLGRSKRRLKDNIKINTKEIRSEDIDLTHLPQNGV
jgi:hypothetical protein